MNIQVLLLVIYHRYISVMSPLVEPVGSARLTFDDDLYYEFM